MAHQDALLMRTLFERLFAPAMEWSGDPAVQIAATFKAERRLRKIASARRKRMKRYAKAWAKKWETPQQATEHRPARVSWMRERVS